MFFSTHFSNFLTILVAVVLVNAEYSVKTVQRDVIIIGGGASGTYTAIRVKDSAKSVAIIESQDRLGGHTETYVDPNTGNLIDIGVVQWHNNSYVVDFLSRLNVPTRAVSYPSLKTINADFRTGKIVQGYVAKNYTAGLQKYAAILQQWPYLVTGFVDIPDPVPEDLLLPWVDFVKKYELEDAAYWISLFNQGMGDPLKQLAIYQIKVFGLPLLQSFQAGLLQEANGNNHAVYEAALAILGEDAHLSSKVRSVVRNGEEIQIVVDEPHGRTIFKASKLVVAIPQRIDKLDFLDLDEREGSLFDKFSNTGYYTGLLRNTGIPAATSLRNIGNDTLYNLPAIPGSYAYQPTISSDLYDVKFGTQAEIPIEQVKDMIRDELIRFQTEGLSANISADVEFITFSSHTPFCLTVSAEEIRGRFYDKLNGMQGYRNTYYAGAALESQGSSRIWAFTEENLIPLLVQ